MKPVDITSYDIIKKISRQVYPEVIEGLEIKEKNDWNFNHPDWYYLAIK